MNVELAEQRIRLLPDRLGAEQAEARAWQKRTEAFGAFARLGGLISRSRDEDYEILYRELRLQPFWRISASTSYVYERRRTHVLKVGPEVETVWLGEERYPVSHQQAAVSLNESCRELSRRDWLFDGVSGKADPALKVYSDAEADSVGPDELNALARSGAIIVPPEARASMLTREVIAQSIRRIEADHILEEKMLIEVIDLCYRPVYALRYRWQAREAVVEVDAITGDARTGGRTFEAYVGRLVDRDFLLDAGAEALNTFIPGVNLAKIIVTRGLKLSARD